MTPKILWACFKPKTLLFLAKSSGGYNPYTVKVVAAGVEQKGNKKGTYSFFVLILFSNMALSGKIWYFSPEALLCKAFSH